MGQRSKETSVMVLTELNRMLNRLQKGFPAKRAEITHLLGLSDPFEINQLFEAARIVQTRYFGDKIFLYGFLYFSTYCRNNCRFCQYRLSNTQISRYRKPQPQILAAAMEMAAAGVHLIDLTMGEDPALYASGGDGFKHFVSMVKTVQRETRLPVMISPGSLPDKILVELAAADVTWYACYQETLNKRLYNHLRPGQDFEKRLEKKQRAKHLGMLIEEGILTGVGETLEDLADAILWMRDVSVDQARVMTFVPQANTPMAQSVPQNSLKEQRIIAVMRLVLQDVLIPASLDVDGLDGLSARLMAGANVVTSIVPPKKGLAGVAHSSLDIEDSRRTLDHILPVLEACGLAPALVSEYLSWTQDRKKAARVSFSKKGKKAC